MPNKPTLDALVFTTETGVYNSNEIRGQFNILNLDNNSRWGYSKKNIVVYSKYYYESNNVSPFVIILSGFVNKNNQRFISTKLISKNNSVERKHIWSFETDLSEIISMEIFYILSETKNN